MRAVVAWLLLATTAWAADLVHLHNGGVLEGVVVAETEDHVVLDLGAGRITVPRTSIRLVERGASRRPLRATDTRRDEWFLVLHRDKVVGWRRFVETRQPDAVQVEERTVFFRPGGGEDVSIRHVETADRAGRPREFLLMESYGSRTEVTSGRVVGDRVTVRVLRDGAPRVRELRLPAGWVLALPRWSRFVTEAEPGEVRTITALDVRRLRPVQLVLRRDQDVPAPESADPHPCRALTLVGDFRRARALYRPAEGSLAVELNGATLVARRATRERVALARRAHAAPRPLQLDEALQFPFYRRPKELTAYHPRGGFSIEAPDAGWLPRLLEADEGRVLAFEKIGLFSSLEVFVYPTGDAPLDVDACLERALARLRLTAESTRVVGEVERCRLARLPARVVRLAARHRRENLRCLVGVVRARDRYLVLVGAAPERWWGWAEDDFARFLDSLVVVP
ncbi:MAG: hypothetical protein ACYTEZ_00630 [Planctomycetota bacterium]|jgi:hypothetical protein